MIKTKVIRWFVAAAVIMVVLPFLTVQFASSDTGMMISILLLLVVNPIFSIVTGVVAGQRPCGLWGLPLVMDALFVIGFGIYMGLNAQAKIYIGIYTAIAYVTMAAAAWWKHRKA